MCSGQYVALDHLSKYEVHCGNWEHQNGSPSGGWQSFRKNTGDKRFWPRAESFINNNSILVRRWLCSSRLQGLCYWTTSQNCGQQWVGLPVCCSFRTFVVLASTWPYGGRQPPLSQRGFKGLFPFPYDPLLFTRWHSPSQIFIRKGPSEFLQFM